MYHLKRLLYNVPQTNYRTHSAATLTSVKITPRRFMKKSSENLSGIREVEFEILRTMQAFTSPYVCPYFTCSSPYCIALRNTAVASTLQSVSNRAPTSPSQPGMSSFTISSILSRTGKTRGEEETNASKASSTESSVSVPKFSPYTSHVSIERFHPYHRPLTASAFARTTCNALQKGKPCNKLDITLLSRVITPYLSQTVFLRLLSSLTYSSL